MPINKLLSILDASVPIKENFEDTKLSFKSRKQTIRKINSPQWLKNKKATINPKDNNYDKCFQYSLTIALNYKQIKKDPQRISKMKPFIDQYNWKDIDFPSRKKDWKKFESNNKSIALDILFVPHSSREIRHGNKSKHTLNLENQVIRLMITDGKKWYYFAVKSLSALFKGIAPNHVGDIYCLNCLHSFRTKNKLKSHKKVCKNHDYCYAEMPLFIYLFILSLYLTKLTNLQFVKKDKRD